MLSSLYRPRTQEADGEDKMKIVINKCYGGFSLSDRAVKWIRKNQPCEHIETLVGEKYPDGKIKEEGYSMGIH